MYIETTEIYNGPTMCTIQYCFSFPGNCLLQLIFYSSLDDTCKLLPYVVNHNLTGYESGYVLQLTH